MWSGHEGAPDASRPSHRDGRRGVPSARRAVAAGAGRADRGCVVDCGTPLARGRVLLPVPPSSIGFRDIAAYTYRLWASRCPRPAPASSGSPGSSRPCRGARCSAAPHSPPASSRRCRPSCLHQARIRQALEHPGEDRLVRLNINQATRPRNRRMIQRRLRQRQSEKLAPGKRIGRPPGDRALRIQSFEIPDQQERK
jgi:hypothetical protein